MNNLQTHSRCLQILLNKSSCLKFIVIWLNFLKFQIIIICLLCIKSFYYSSNELYNTCTNTEIIYTNRYLRYKYKTSHFEGK